VAQGALTASLEAAHQLWLTVDGLLLGAVHLHERQLGRVATPAKPQPGNQVRDLKHRMVVLVV